MAKKTDYTDWTKEDLIKRVKALEKRKKYGLVWDEEREAEKIVLGCQNNLPVLKEATKKQIITNKDDVTHILIEGDNYHALSVLNYTHEKGIDVIYIDPPYNTGARDWKYNNNYVDDNDAWRHSKWLSFMDNRLRLAKRLLKATGVLICTIDDNEHATLGVLLKELFPDRQIVCISIVHNPGGIQGKNFSYCHEYAYFIHPKNGTYISKVTRDDIDPTPLRDWGKESSKREAAKTCFYPILSKGEIIVGFGDVCSDDFHPSSSNITRSDEIIEIYPVDAKGVERKWRFSRKSIEGIRDELICRKVKDEYVILRVKRDYRWKTVWTDPKYNANVYGTQLLNSILQTDFPYPKSLYAVEDCIDAIIHMKENAVILDFFAGSGTTGHAVLAMNNRDNGKRQFILCTDNENNICTEVCYPRISKVIHGYEDRKTGANVAGLGGNLKYYKTEFVTASPTTPTDKGKEQLTRQSIEMLTLKEGTFEKVNEKPEYVIYRNPAKYTGIIFDQTSFSDFKKAIAKFDKPISLYIFSLADDDFGEDFADLQDIVKICAIPEAILRVYRRIFR